MINFDDFLKVDIRVGRINDVRHFPEAHLPAYQLWINFGQEIGIKKASARITENYTPETLIGKQVLAVVNFPQKQIGKFMSEVLVLGLPDENNQVLLAVPDSDAPLGSRLY